MHSFKSLSAIVTLCLSLRVLASIGPVTDLHIVNANISPDGFSRPAVLAETVFPGPLIVGNKGDQFQINVIDELTNEDMLKSTSIHWHGFFQAGTNWADGVSFVNQCPISTGHAFLYDFNGADQAGTFWYHSHLETQYCDGLRGPMVVYDPNDPHASLYDVDDESTVITLADWYHTLARQGPAVPTPSSTLINGLGRQWSDGTGPLAVITVTAGKRYRFRVVNIACDPNYVFSIDQHTFTVIEADGVSLTPSGVDSATIFVGQRYSLVMSADQPVGNYWIRAKPNGGTTTFTNGINSAILRYVGAATTDPTSTQGTSTSPLVETALHPLSSSGVPGQPVAGGADFVRNLLFDFTGGVFHVNGASFTSPSVPVLLQILSGQQNAQNLLPAGSVIELPSNAVVELSMPGGVVGGGHPLHLHGHNFHVIRSAGSSTYNYVDPVIRDVVNIGGAGDNVTIRFETNNPGPWFLHCHIDWHLQLGFALVFAEAIPDVASANPVPSDWSQLCPTYDALDPSDL